MLVSEIEDCEVCPLKEEGFCTGGWSSGAGGVPIEPPCASWNGDEDTDDLIDSYRDMEHRFDMWADEEKKKKREKEEKAEKAAFIRSWSRSSVKRVNDIKKTIKAVESAKASFCSIRHATSTVNKIFGYNGDNSGYSEDVIKRYDSRLTELKESLEEAEDIARKKKQEARH